LFVWGAGNDGFNLDDPETHPSLVNGFYDLPNLIAVGAHDRNGDRSVWDANASSSFSPSNAHVHLYAPGTDGWTTHRYNNFGTYSGTSMATPHVAGVAALMLSINPNLSASQIKSDLMQHSDAIQISAPGFQSFTVNKLDAFKPVLYTSSDVLYTDGSVSTGQTLSLNKGIAVTNGAVLSFSHNAIIQESTSSIIPEYFGFRVFGGTMILDNCTFHSPTLLQAVGANSTIIIRNSTNFDNITKIEILDGATLIIEDSHIVASGLNVYLNDANFQITNSDFTLSNQSQLTMRRAIVQITSPFDEKHST
jgi:hypothetical protein